MNPNAAAGGDTLTLEVHGFMNPADYQGKVFEVRILEADAGQDKGRPSSKNDLLATFQAEVINYGTMMAPKLAFDKVVRTDYFPSMLPPESPRISAEGHPLAFEPNFKLPHFKVCLATKAGKSPEFLVLIKGDPGERESYVYEIIFEIMVARKVVFSSATMPAFLDCKNFLNHNCIRAALMQIVDHREMVNTRGVGLRYGSDCTEPTLTTDKAAYKLSVTSCIDFLLEATALGHEKSLAKADWKRIRSFMREGKGTLLFKGFEEAGWIGLYYNPDIHNSSDKLREHSFSYEMVQKHAKYYDLKVRASIINYRPTKTFDDGMSPKSVTPLDSSHVAKLKGVPFGVLVAKGGRHTALIMSGVVYEVHWEMSARDVDLYTATDFEADWPWLSGLIMVPPGFWT
jgi:hypothetical protein